MNQYEYLKKKLNKISNTKNDILSPLARHVFSNEDMHDITNENINDKFDITSKDIYNDFARDSLDYDKRDTMQPLEQSARFLRDELKKLNIPILGYRYENMDIQEWNDSNKIEKGKSNFSVDVITKDGSKKTFTVPIIFENGKMIDPEYFLDSVGRKYAFTREGINDYLVEDFDDEEPISYNESNDVIDFQGGVVDPTHGSMASNNKTLKVAYYIQKAKELRKWANENKEKEKNEKDENNTKEKSDKKGKDIKDLQINFEGAVVVTDSNGEEILRFDMSDLSAEDIKAVNAKDIAYFTNKLKKLEELGLTLEQKPDMGISDIDSDIVNDDELKNEIPEIEKINPDEINTEEEKDKNVKSEEKKNAKVYNKNNTKYAYSNNDLRIDTDGRIEIWINKYDIENINSSKFQEIVNSIIPDDQKIAQLKDLAIEAAYDKINNMLSGTGIDITMELSIKNINLDRINWDDIIHKEKE